MYEHGIEAAALATMFVMLLIVVVYVVGLRRMLMDRADEREFINELLERNQHLRDELVALKIKAKAGSNDANPPS